MVDKSVEVVIVIDVSNYIKGEKVPFKASVRKKYEHELLVVSQATFREYELYYWQTLEYLPMEDVLKRLSVDGASEDKPIDFEALGFVVKFVNGRQDKRCWTKPVTEKAHPLFGNNLDIVYEKSNSWALLSTGDDETSFSDWKTHFAGYIKNHREMEVILRMCKLF